MSDEATLLPCPFCGGEAGSRWQYRLPGAYACYLALCQECGSASAAYGLEAEAIAAWNTRAERTCRNLAYAPNVNFECSECGCAVYGGDSLGANIENGCWNVCPNCGAKVVKE